MLINKQIWNNPITRTDQEIINDDINNKQENNLKINHNTDYSNINKTEKNLLYELKNISKEYLYKHAGGFKSLLILFDNLLINRKFIKLPGDEQTE
jgi:hypothetical protein